MVACAVLAGLALLWLVGWLPAALDDPWTFDEEQREAGGLLLVALLIGSLGVLGWRARRRGPPARRHPADPA